MEFGRYGRGRVAGSARPEVGFGHEIRGVENCRRALRSIAMNIQFLMATHHSDDSFFEHSDSHQARLAWMALWMVAVRAGLAIRSNAARASALKAHAGGAEEGQRRS